MLELLRSLFPARSLADLTVPRRVSLDGVVGSENTLVAPISGLRGAVIELAVFVPVFRVSSRGERYQEMVHVSSRAYVPDMLHVACPGGVLEVSPGRARFEFPGGGYGLPIDRPLPPEFARALQSVEYDGPVHARESILSKGHRVHVRGTVIPGERRGEATGYRTLAASPMFTPGDDVIIADRSLA